MPNKKGIELSLNFFVILILSLVLFGLGVTFMSKLFTEAQDIASLTAEDIDDKVGSLVCEGSDIVCVGEDKKKAKRTGYGIFGVKILNIMDSQEFEVTISRPIPSGFTADNKDIASDNLLINPQSRSVYIQRNEEQKIGIGIQVPADAVSGTYIFNIDIKTAGGEQYGTVQKLYAVVS